MYFKASGRTNSSTKKYDSYYRLVESYSNETGRIYHRTVLNVGFIGDELTPEQLNKIARTLTDMYQRKQSIFPDVDPLFSKGVAELWSSEPGVKLKALQLALKIKHRPFTKLKFVVHKPKLKNLEKSIIRELPLG